MIVDQLVLLISPILSFTAEEIWQNNSFLSKQKESVFLSGFDEIPNIDCDLSSKNWQRLFEIKEVVNQQIEESRNLGKIKGSLDEDKINSLLLSAQHYVQNYKLFKLQLKKVED